MYGLALFYFTKEKIKNHLKFSAQRENINARYGFALMERCNKNQNFLKNTCRAWVHGLALFNKFPNKFFILRR